MRRRVLCCAFLTLLCGLYFCNAWAIGDNAKVEIISVLPRQVLCHAENEGLVQPVVVKLSSATDIVVEIMVDDKKICNANLSQGEHSVEIMLPEVSEETLRKLSLWHGEVDLASQAFKQSPVKHWTIYLVQHTHTDIGYTKPQTEILTEHLRYIDYALAYCDATADYPADARFKWTCETAWAVDEYLKTRPKEQIARLKHHIEAGNIEVTGLYFHFSEIVDERTLQSSLAPLRSFREHGIPVYTAMQNDVNGVAWSFADYLPDLGVKYLWMGHHKHKALLPFDKPTIFRWESPSGRTLTAYRGEHYMTANYWGIEKGNLVELEHNMLNYLRSLEERAYPYDAIGIQYSGYYTDNSPPSAEVCRIIKQWNEKYAYPRLRSSLAHEFMDYISVQTAVEMPVRRVAYPDWWSDGFGSAARETAMARQTHSDAIVAEGLLAMASSLNHTLPPHSNAAIERIHRDLLFYDEHTFGASESLTDPSCWNSVVQWAQKSAYVWSALKDTKMLYEHAAGLLQEDLPRCEYPTLTLYNTMGYARTALAKVYIDYEIIPKDRAFKIVDNDGNALTVQVQESRNEGRYYRIEAPNLPAMGYRTYKIIVSQDEAKPASVEQCSLEVLENEFYRLTLSASGAISSIVDKTTGAELVDQNAEWNLGAVIYERLADRWPLAWFSHCDFSRTGLRDVRVERRVSGEMYQSILLRGALPSVEPSFGVQLEIKLFNNIKRIELDYAMRREPEIEPSSIYVAFPFLQANGKLAFDVHGGTVWAGENQLEGSSSAWNTVQSFVAVQGGGQQIVLSCADTPLVQLGNLLNDDFQYVKRYEHPHIYSWVMNNYWTTNFKATQEGEFRWRYAITSTDEERTSEAVKFGYDNRLPIYARVMPAGEQKRAAWEYSAFEIGSDNIVMISCAPAEKRGYLLCNVREAAGETSMLQFRGQDGRLLPFEVVDVLGEPLSGKYRERLLRPYEQAFVRLRVK